MFLAAKIYIYLQLEVAELSTKSKGGTGQWARDSWGWLLQWDLRQSKGDDRRKMCGMVAFLTFKIGGLFYWCQGDGNGDDERTSCLAGWVSEPNVHLYQSCWPITWKILKLRGLCITIMSVKFWLVFNTSL